jgi:hypothetical protein
MSGIPAASLSDLDIERIRTANPLAASKIERVAALLRKGEETEDDMLRICTLLLEIGETAKAESLLVANSTYGDRLHALHRQFFGDVECFFAKALADFSGQLGLSLKPIASDRLYSCIFECTLNSAGKRASPFFQDLPPSPLETHITYEPMIGIVADIYTQSDPFSRALPLRYDEGTWVRDWGGLTQG